MREQIIKCKSPVPTTICFLIVFYLCTNLRSKVTENLPRCPQNERKMHKLHNVSITCQQVSLGVTEVLYSISVLLFSRYNNLRHCSSLIIHNLGTPCWTPQAGLLLSGTPGTPGLSPQTPSQKLRLKLSTVNCRGQSEYPTMSQ